MEDYYYRTHLRRDTNNELYARVNIINPSPIEVQTQLPLDGSTNAPITIDYVHHELHDGDGYYITRAITLGDAGTDEILIVTPAGTKHAHMLLAVSGTGQTDFLLYEDATRAGGTALTPRNRNRNYADASMLTVTHTPTGGAVGTLIAETLFGVDAGGGTNRQLSGGASDSRSEFILKSNTKYLMAVTSGTADNRITIILDWYEHTDRSM